MLVVMNANATAAEIAGVVRVIESLGLRAHSMPGATRTAIGVTGNQGEVESGAFEEMAGVAEVIRVSKPYKLVSRDLKQDDTVVRFGAAPDAPTIGGKELAIMAG